MSSLGEISRSTGSLLPFIFWFFVGFFFCFVCFVFTVLLLIKITKLGAFLIGFTIFIFKLCFSHFDCIDSLLPSFFSMFILLCKNMHLEMVSLQYFYSSPVVLRILCIPTKDYFYARSCVQRELCKHFVCSSITWNCFWTHLRYSINRLKNTGFLEKILTQCISRNMKITVFLKTDDHSIYYAHDGHLNWDLFQ